jgi:hypothetical protein
MPEQGFTEKGINDTKTASIQPHSSNKYVYASFLNIYDPDYFKVLQQTNHIFYLSRMVLFLNINKPVLFKVIPHPNNILTFKDGVVSCIPY